MSSAWIISYIGWLVSAGWFVFRIAKRESTHIPMILAWMFVAFMFITN